MRRGVAAVIGSGLMLMASPASADVLVPAGQNEVATCVRDAGPGQLAMQAPPERGSTPVDLLGASPERIERTAGVDLGDLVGCPAVASGGGVTAIAGVTAERGGPGVRLRVAARGDGAAFAEPQTLAESPLIDAGDVALAVGPRGDGVVAWSELRLTSRDPSVRIMAARLPAGPGARWGTPEEVVPWRVQDDFAGDTDVAAGVDESGRATVAWQLGVPDTRRRLERSELAVATAGPGEPLRTTQLAPSVQGSGELALAVAPDGAAVLVVPADGAIGAHERPAGGGAFAPRVPLAEVSEERVQTAVALDPGGAALVAWSYTDYTAPLKPRRRVAAARRPAGGPFGRPAVVSSRPAPNDDGSTTIAISDGGPPLENADLRARLAADGRAAIAWVESRRVGGDSMPAAFLATGEADGRYAVAALGNPCRPVNAVAPFTGADGELLAAWTDNATHRFADEYEVPHAAGRLHVTTVPPPGPGPQATPPRLTAAAPRGIQKLWLSQAAELTATCDAPCDLRAFVPGEGGPVHAGGTTLAAAGRARLRLYSGLRALTRRAPRTLPVVVHACSPDGTGRSRTTTRVRVARRRPPPVAAPLGVRATPTAGGNVIVTWHTAFPARRVDFLVVGRPHSLESPPFGASYATVEGRGRTRFSAVVRAQTGQKIRTVTVEPYSLEGIRGPRGVEVRVER